MQQYMSNIASFSVVFTFCLQNMSAIDLKHGVTFKCCNVSGMSSVNRKDLGKMGLQALCYYAVTSLMAVFTGIALVVLIQPGKSPENTSAPSDGEVEAVHTVDAFLDLLRCPSKRINQLH